MITAKQMQEAALKLTKLDPSTPVQFEQDQNRAVIKDTQGKVLAWIPKHPKQRLLS